MQKLRIVPVDATAPIVAFFDGKNGWASQVRRCEEYGVNITSTRETYDAEWIVTFTVDGLAGEFATFQEMNEAIQKALGEANGS